MNTSQFIQTIHDFRKKNRRDLEWRRTITPYNVFISEIMLQQTQVARVTSAFPRFIMQFPDFNTLAGAAVADVLGAWQGMGYNRRALYLKKTASIITEQYNGVLPQHPDVLQTFPAIGPTTARSIVTFAFNKPTVFIETNIRRVFIHCFFNDHAEISDKEILPLVEQTLDRTNPREWYYALMDYGSYLAKIVENPNRKSTHYKKQSAFEGSMRYIRGQILKILLKEKTLLKKELNIRINDRRFETIIAGLIKEGFVKEDDTMYSIV